MPLHMCVGTGPEARVSPEGPQPAQPGREVGGPCHPAALTRPAQGRGSPQSGEASRVHTTPASLDTQIL